MRVKTFKFGSLKVGGRLLLPLMAASSVRQAAWNYGKRHERSFSVNIIVVQGKRYIRVRRTR